MNTVSHLAFWRRHCRHSVQRSWVRFLRIDWKPEEGNKLLLAYAKSQLRFPPQEDAGQPGVRPSQRCQPAKREISRTCAMVSASAKWSQGSQEELWRIAKDSAALLSPPLDRWGLGFASGMRRTINHIWIYCALWWYKSRFKSSSLSLGGNLTK